MKSKTSTPEQTIPFEYNKITLCLTPIQKQCFDKACDDLDMNGSQLFQYLIENHYECNLPYIERFRYNLIKRVRRGIDAQYIRELTKLYDYLDTLLNKLR